MSFLDRAPLGPAADQRRASIRKAPPGLEVARFWREAADLTPDSGRRLLSYVAAAFLARGWLQSVDRVLDSAAETLGESADQVRADLDALAALDLLYIEGGKFVTIAGLLSTRPTGIVFKFDAQHEVALAGPLAAVAASRALHRAGSIRALCSHDHSTRIELTCDPTGITERDPEQATLFLPSWSGGEPPSAAAKGGLFGSDEALDRWQVAAGNPDGMPVNSFLFGMAVGNLADEVGAPLEAVLNHLPDFD